MPQTRGRSQNGADIRLAAPRWIEEEGGSVNDVWLAPAPAAAQ